MGTIPPLPPTGVRTRCPPARGPCRYRAPSGATGTARTALFGHPKEKLGVGMHTQVPPEPGFPQKNPGVPARISDKSLILPCTP